MKREHSSPAEKNILPFPEWVEQTYPKKTAKREFLRMIGALDMAYLMYRTKAGQNKEPMQKIEPAHVIPSMPLKVEEHAKPLLKKSKKSTQSRIEKKEVAPKPNDLAIEFEQKPDEKPAKTKKPKAIKKAAAPKAPKKVKELTISFRKETEPAVVHPKKILAPAVHEEPEPLVLETESIESVLPSPGKRAGGGRGAGGEVWLNDESLEETDLRKLKQPLTVDGITVSFNVRDNQGDDETVITVNDTAWRALLTSPALDLSAMAQIVRASYGELYVLGRMALGAMSGEGYIESCEAVRIVKLLAEATGSTVTCDVAYFDKDAASKTRTSNFMHVRFERV